MIHRLKNLFAPALLATALAACGGGGGAASYSDAAHDSIATGCDKAHECMADFPGSEAEFEQFYGANAGECVDNLTPLVEANIEEVEASIEAGRIEYDSGAASECLDATSSVSCADFWGGEDPAACDDVLTGTVPDDGECTIDEDCATEGAFCDGVCIPPA